KKFGFITNKYTVSVLILLCLLLADIILHKGMSRVIIPSSFSEKIKPVNLPLCNQPLLQKDKHWVKAVDNIVLMQKLPANTAGIECDVYFDMLKDHFEVYHDSSAPAVLNLDSLLAVYSVKKLNANVWLDFKNLTAENSIRSLIEITRLKNKYKLFNQLIVESHNPQYLKAFCDSGYFTSYYVPSFNPYKATEIEVVQFTDSIRHNLTRYPTSALSGYYFQYPVLKRFFPNYPILTWADNASISVVSYLFKRQLENEESIKVILYPFKD
ncbi:MAG: hypothetical protein ABI741_03920, partial [Ferruginibacter sp.]